MRVLKKKMQREGIFRELKQRRSYEKPSQRKVRERAEPFGGLARSRASRLSATACFRPRSRNSDRAPLADSVPEQSFKATRIKARTGRAKNAV